MEAAQREILAAHNLLGRFGPIVARWGSPARRPAIPAPLSSSAPFPAEFRLAHDSKALAAHPTLRASVLLALTKLMAVDQHYCEANLPLVFTWLENRSAVEPEARQNIVIAVGDLAVRWPNTVEPWTEFMYK